MSIFGSIFGKRTGSGNVGNATCDLVVQFLRSSSQHKASVFTFTELFAFVYFEIDSVLYGRKIPARASVAESLTDAYTDTLRAHYNLTDEEPHLAMLTARIQEYGGMLNARKEKSDIVEKLDFYLSQASRLGAYHRDGETPFVLADVFANMKCRMELTQFYVGTLAPFTRGIIAKHQ